MPYVQRNQSGAVVGTFANLQPSYATEWLEVNDPQLLPASPTPLQQIRALEQAHDDDQRMLNRQSAIDTALSVACRNPAAAGKTRDEVHAIYYATNRGYKAMFDLEAACSVLRKLIV